MDEDMDTLSIDTKGIIESKLQDRYLEFLVAKGFLKKEESQSVLPVPKYLLEKVLWDPIIVNATINYFNKLKANLRGWFKIEEIEVDQLRKDGLVGDKDDLSEKGHKAVMQLIEDFIASEVRPKN